MERIVIPDLCGDEDEKEELAIEWTESMATKEIKQLKEQGLVPLRLHASNYGILVDSLPNIINRIEIKSNYDFEKGIKQLLIGESREYPHKQGFMFVNVLLLTEQQHMPFVLPYIYKSDYQGTQNDLTQWLLINASGAHARLSIDAFDKI